MHGAATWRLPLKLKDTVTQVEEVRCLGAVVSAFRPHMSGATAPHRSSCVSRQSQSINLDAHFPSYDARRVAYFVLAVIKLLLSGPWICRLISLRDLWRSRLAYILRRPPSPFDLWPPLTERQREASAHEFIESIDTDAVRSLASKCNGGLSCSIRCRHQGSFNVCFVVDFRDGTTRLVRLPIEPAVHEVWDKVCSEVYTMQYVRDHTTIPVPRVYAYGRSRLRRNTSAQQVFMVLDYVDGQSLTKKMLRDSPEARRRQCFEEVVDILAQLRGLSFALGGSLMPDATMGVCRRLWHFMFPREELLMPPSTLDDCNPKIVGAFSMRKNELQIDGYTAPRFIATSAKEFLGEQYQLLQYMWKMPCQTLGRDEAERGDFALHTLSLEEAEKTFGLKADSPGDTFYLSHPDLRVDNIIVDDELHIRAVVDWEFSVTVPPHAFLPPSWLTGHDTGSIVSKVDHSSEFMSVLSSRKQQSPNHSQLSQEWDFRDASRLAMAYIFLDPSDLEILFYRFIYPGRYNEPRDKVVPGFFQRPENKGLRRELEKRLLASERYTQYLKCTNLLDDSDDQWQLHREWTKETKMTLGQLRDWSEETELALARMDGERTRVR